jgi:hypothetical protein
MQLAGSGDLVMTDLRGTAAGLVLPAGLKGRVMVRDAAERLVVELKKPAGRVIDLGLDAGEIRVTVDDGGALSETRMLLTDGKRTELDAKALTPVAREVAVARGDLPSASSAFIPPATESQADDEPAAVRVGLVPGGSDRADNRFAINLGVGRYRSLHGVDVGFGGSIYLADLHGLQANLGVSWADGETHGAQLAAGIAFTGGDFTGLQNSSGVTVVRGRMTGLQGSSMFSWAGAVKGWQGSGLVSMANREVHGVQAGGIGAFAGGEFVGVQAGGLGAWTGGPAEGFQTAGLLAYAKGSFEGFQAAGLASVGRDVVDGYQAAGLFTLAGELHGLQTAPVNVAGSAAGGWQVGLVNLSEDAPVAIGFLSLVTKGQHHLSLTGSELGPALEGKLGGTVVYTVYTAGYTPGAQQWLRFGLGLGGHVDLSDRLFLEIEGLCNTIYKSGNWTGDNVLATGRVALGYKVAGDLAIVAGPTWNTYVAWDERVRDFGYGTVYVSQGGGHSVRNWIGGSAGLQF